MSARAPQPLQRGACGGCASGHPLATHAAADVLGAGGSAADAAVAAAAVLSVVLPEACGLGGEAMAVVSPPGQAPVALNGSGRAPAALAGPVPPDGGGTVAVPAAVAAWFDLLAAHGRMTPGRVLAPAVDLAERGFPVTAGTLGAVAEQRVRLERGAAGYALLDPKLVPGGIVRLPVLARTLRRLAAEGPAAVYEGPLAEAIAAAVRGDGGAMAAEDLAAHRSTTGPTLTAHTAVGRLDVPGPSSQAVLLPMIVNAVAKTGLEEGPERLHALIEAAEAAFAHRDGLVDREAAERALDAPLRIDLERATRRGGPRAYSHTTAIATADSDGLVVSMLVSIFDDFGAALLVPEGGFLLNDRLLGFTGPPNVSAAGRMPVSTLAPALVTRQDGRTALATPGADGQVQTLAQVLLLLGDGVPLDAALGRPRVRSQAGRVLCEATAAPGVREGLGRRGHEFESRPALDPIFGAVAAAGCAEDGTVFAAADPRRDVFARAI